jgi:hypothetical protein
MQALVLWYLVAMARADYRGPGAIVFEIDVDEVTRALTVITESRASDRATRRALEDLMGPESVLPGGPPRLDVLPCDGLAVPERYRVLFFGDPRSVELPPDALA